ncbi:hypothetical protein [Butyrivibrio sp. INlla21]|uniref:hypothetical protein n=1 Tax=Butyrivibrio sp. INlla21 TaxID=1520811 RepID=UPI0008ED5779|nr:hypothetical protein [Butyrivibrio sp. INlla21]SFU33443.1 hypothetical protein SAMN02910342_00121 [Butyrivibrio sp. INlla21]
MYKWDHTYTDYNGNERTETFYFNLSKGELLDLEWRTPGGLENYMKHIMSMMDGQALADTFKMLVDKSYGVKGPDGRTFIKTPEVLNNFKFTEAYSDLYMLLATDDKAAAAFINGIFPKEAVEAAHKQREMAEKAGLSLVDTAKDTAQVQAESTVPLVEGQEVMTPISPLPTV